MNKNRKRILLAVAVAIPVLVGATVFFWPSKPPGPMIGGPHDKPKVDVPSIPLAPKEKTLANVPLFELPWKPEPDVDGMIAARTSKDAAGPTSEAVKVADPNQPEQGVAVVPFGPDFKPPTKVGGQTPAIANPQRANSPTPAAPTLSQAEKDQLVAKYMQQICGNDKPTLEDWKILSSSKPDGLLKEDLPPLGNSRFIVSLCEDLQGRIWIGCEDEGIWRYDDRAELAKQWQRFTRKNTGGPDEPKGATIESGDFLGDDNGYAMVCDKLGRIWVGHLNHGVSVYNGKGWKNYNILEGPIGERVFAMATCPTDGDVWIATSAGLSRYSLSKDTWSYFTRAEGLPSDQASSIAFDKDGNIVVGTQSDGLALADAKDDYKTWRQVSCPKEYVGRVPTVASGNGLPTNLINHVFVSRTNTLYVATITGLAWSKDRGATFKFVRGQDWAEKNENLFKKPAQLNATANTPILAEDYIKILAEDEQGRLCIGYRSKGYELRSPDSLEVSGNREFATSDISSILMDNHRPAMIGTYLNGIFRPRAYSASAIAAPSQSIANFPAPAAKPGLDELNQLLAKLGSSKSSMAGPKVIPMPDDWMTQGNWLGRYGKFWANICAIKSPNSYFMGVGNNIVNCVEMLGAHNRNNDTVRYWVHWLYTDNIRSLELPPAYLKTRVDKGLTTWKRYRRQAEIDDHGEVYPITFDGPHLYLTLRAPAGDSQLSMYFMNKDGHYMENSWRDFDIEIRPGRFTEVGYGDTPSVADMDKFEQSPLLAQSRIVHFWGGVYKRFLLHGGGWYSIKIGKNYSYDALVSAITIDQLDEQPAPFFWNDDPWSVRQRQRVEGRAKMGLHDWTVEDMQDRATEERLAEKYLLEEKTARPEAYAARFKPCDTVEKAAHLLFEEMQWHRLRDRTAWANMQRQAYLLLARYYQGKSETGGLAVRKRLATCYFQLSAQNSFDENYNKLNIQTIRDMILLPQMKEQHD